MIKLTTLPSIPLNASYPLIGVPLACLGTYMIRPDITGQPEDLVAIRMTGIALNVLAGLLIGPFWRSTEPDNPTPPPIEKKDKITQTAKEKDLCLRRWLFTVDDDQKLDD